MGKELIQNIVRLTRQDRFAHRIVFVEDYDMNVARQLVQGVDVWLNNPRRPQEASGTSRPEGRCSNGALNFSILDGWWAEAYDGTNGFAIGIGQTHAVPSVQDERDHKALIETLTNQVVPLYYNRDASGLPRELDRPAEERASDAGLAVQRGPDGDGLRAAQLSAGRRRRVVLDAPILIDRVGRRRVERRSSHRGLHRRSSIVLGALAVGCQLGQASVGGSADRNGVVAIMSQVRLIGEKLGSFRIESVLGSGAMGVVYRATNEKTGRPAAVKVVSGEIAQQGKVRERFEREAEILQQFRHPNIVRFLAVGRFQGTSYFAMEFVAGRDPGEDPPATAGRCPGARWSTWGSRSATRSTTPTSTAWCTAI